jgi:hypothetical protein
MYKICLLTLLLIAPQAWSQSAAQLQAQLGQGGGAKKPKLWGTTLTTTTTISAKELSAYNSTLNQSFSAVFRYKLPYFNTRFIFGGNKDLTLARQDRFTTGIIEASKSLKSISNKNVISIFQGRFLAPVNDDRRFNETYRGGLSARLLNIFIPPFPGFQFINIASFTKNLHEFEINRAGGQNTNFSFVDTFIAAYSVTPALELSGYLSLVWSWDYKGERRDNQYVFGQSATYNIDRNFGVTLGHELGGATYGVSGSALDVGVFNSDNSSFYASLTFNY